VRREAAEGFLRFASRRIQFAVSERSIEKIPMGCGRSPR